jgi:hypothetical protein
VREKAAEFTEALKADICASANVVYGEGFGASMAHSFLVAYELLTKRPFPSKTFRDVSEAVKWLASHDSSLTTVQSTLPAEIMALIRQGTPEAAAKPVKVLSPR